MSGINKVTIVGRLGQDPEVRYTAAGQAVASLSVATSEKWKDKEGKMQEKTEWHRLVAWGQTAELAGKYLKKGALAGFDGKLQTRDYEDKAGVKKYTTEIVVQSLYFLEAKRDGDRAPHPSEGAPGRNGSGYNPAAGGQADSGDINQIPF